MKPDFTEIQKASEKRALSREVERTHTEELRRLNAELERQTIHLKEVNQILTDSEQRLRLAIATGRIGLWVWNSTDTANSGDWSDRLKEIFGLPLDAEVTHDMFLKCVHPEDRDSVDRAVMDALAGADGGNYRAEYRTIHPTDGSMHWVTARGQACFDPNGQPVRFIGTVMDITERKNAEQAAERANVELETLVHQRTADLERANQALAKSEDSLRLAIDTIPGLVWTSRPDGHIEYLNKRWLDYTGLKQAEAAGWGWQAAVHPDDLSGLTDYWKSILATGAEGEYEARLRRADGQHRWFLFRGVPLRNEEGRVVKWYGTNTDIEALRASEHVARGQLDALTQMLGALSKEVDPERLLEHVARMIRDQMATHSVTFWANNDAGVLERLVTFEGDTLLLATESASAPRIEALRSPGHPVWDEFFRTGADCVEGWFDCDPPRVRLANREDAAWHPAFGKNPLNPAILAAVKEIAGTAIATALTVPMVISGRFEGIISARFRQKRNFRPEDLELVKALARQAMLIVQMMRLSKQSRMSAVIEERNRMARDIHDTLAQGFTGVIMQLQAAKGAIGKRALRDAGEHIERAEDLARSSLGEARRSVRALRPSSLRGGSLFMALGDLLKRTTNGTELRTELKAEGEHQMIPEDWQDGLLRITQESLTNALRHSKARMFRATLSFDSLGTQLRLTDDGCGFDPGAEHEGLGLIGMKERVQAMGGRFVAKSHLGRGTEILVILTHTASSQSLQGVEHAE